MKQNFNNKTGMLEFHEEYDGELAMAFNRVDNVDPDKVLVYVLCRDDGNETYSGEGGDDAPIPFTTREEADDALSMLDTGDGWEVYAVSWYEEDDDGEEDEIDGPEADIATA